jgi:hypothetical protein
MEFKNSKAKRTIYHLEQDHIPASTAGKAILTGAPNNWIITDGGEIYNVFLI